MKWMKRRPPQEAEGRRARMDELRASLATQLAQRRQRLDVMRQRHAINDCFYIWHSGTWLSGDHRQTFVSTNFRFLSIFGVRSSARRDDDDGGGD